MPNQGNINNILTKLSEILQTLKECEDSTSNEIKQIESMKLEKENLATQLSELNKELELQTQVTDDLELKRRKFIETLESEEAALRDKIQSIRTMAEQWTIPTVAKEPAAKKVKEEKTVDKEETAEVKKEKKPATEQPKPKPTVSDGISNTETLFTKIPGRPSLNDKIEAKSDIVETGTPIGDIAKAIRLNDRLLFIKEIFEGDDAKFQQTVEKLNGMDNFNQAMAHIKQVAPHWEPNSETSKLFLAIVRRRYL